MAEYEKAPFTDRRDPLRAPVVAGVQRLSAVDTVRARIALAIEHGLLEPDEALPPDEAVAEALGVGVTTVRRAFRTLADDGVVVRRRGRAGGTFVAHGARTDRVTATEAFRADADTVNDLIDRRALMESALAQFAALAATAEQLDRLEKHIAAAAAARDWSTFHAADEQFHRSLAASSGQAWALESYGRTLESLYAYFVPYPVAFLQENNQEHARLVEALRRRDPGAAAAIARDHVLALHGTMFTGLDDRTHH